jgi:Terminase RNaseH-like domain
MEHPELKRAVCDQYERFRPDVVLIEDKASGTQLIQELIADGLHAATRYQPQSDKIMRLHAQTAMIENGLCPLPDAAPWLSAYLQERDRLPRFGAGLATSSTATPACSVSSTALSAGVRAILRKQEKRPGIGRCQADHQGWPNAFFATHGLFTLRLAYEQARHSR